MSHCPIVALLGRPDLPTDGVEDYSSHLRDALAQRGWAVELKRVPWAELGWSAALRRLRRHSAGWAGSWVLVQYTALSWSRRGFPFSLLRVLGVLRASGTRCVVVFHDAVPYPGERLIDCVRRACQVWVMRHAYRMSDRSVLTVPLDRVTWLPANPTKAVFIPVGANLPEIAEEDRSVLPSADRKKVVAVFGVTGGPNTSTEVQDIAHAVGHVARSIPHLRLVVVGRGAKQSQAELTRALDGASVELSVLGVLPEEHLARALSAVDVLLFVRGQVSTWRGSVLAGIACGLPIVGYQGPETAFPIIEAGVELVLLRDRQALAQALEKVLVNPSHWSELRERSRRAYRKYFAWDVIARQFEATFESDDVAHASRGTERATNSRRYRVLVVCSHPIQYATPLFRLLAQHAQIDLRVAYCSLQGAVAGVDPEFGVSVRWDVPLLDGYPWVHVPNRAPRPGLGHFFGLCNPGLWRLVRQGQFDAVVTHTGYYYLSFWLAALAAKSCGAALIFATDAAAIHPRDPKRWKAWLKPRLAPRIFRFMDMLTVASRASQELMLSLGIPEERIAVTPFVVDNDWWRERAAHVDRAAVRASWGVPAESAVALFCAKLQPWKRPMDLLQAFAKAAVPNAYLVFAGEGPLRALLEQEARTRGLADRVRFLGFVNQSQLPGIYSSTDLFVLPSAYEPFAVVVNEAMLCGCPAVVSDRVGARFDLVEPGRTGFIYPCGNVAALAHVLREALADRNRLGSLGDAARKRMETWSPREYVKALVAAIEVAVQAKRRGPLADFPAPALRPTERG